MTITQYRDRLARLTGDLRRAQYDGNLDEVDRIQADIDRALDDYNATQGKA